MSKISGFLKPYKRYSYKFTPGAIFHNAVPKHACFGISLIHTCNLGKVNIFDYLTALQKHSSEVFKNPRNWLPWNYQHSFLVNDS